MIVLSLFHTHLETTEGNYNGKMGKQYFDYGFTVAFQYSTFLSNFFFRKQKLFYGTLNYKFQGQQKSIKKKGQN
jgi:hypothetical protein